MLDNNNNIFHKSDLLTHVEDEREYSRLKRIAVLISGNGSNLQAILDATQNGPLKYRAHVVQVLSNRTDAYGLERARKANVPSIITLTLKAFKDAGKSREDYDYQLAQSVLDVQPDIVVLAGFMHILSPKCLDQFKNLKAIINLHPALPGKFDGAHAIERAFQAYQSKEITETGVMIHRVIAEVDRGEVILVEKVPIFTEDRLEDLERRIHEVEHRLIVRALQVLLKDSSE
jgi:formyltetrahydrofolate-dependent phosphoribosylglycinamide formyltransferase